MDPDARPAGSARARARWWGVGCAVLVVTAAVLVLLAVREDPSGEASARVDDVSTPVPTRPSPAALVPERLQIASIGVSTDLVRLGLNRDRTVEVPQEAEQAGWFSPGTVPGQPGSSVVLGHVDSAEGPAVFHDLSKLRPGDPIEIQRSDGSVARFEVDRVVTYANEDFPADEVYAGSPERPALNLVTCGGEYDEERGGWQSNVIAFTTYVGTTAKAA